MTKPIDLPSIESQPSQIGEPENWLTRARRFARPKVIAEGWSDADIDRIIDEEREAVGPIR